MQKFKAANKQINKQTIEKRTGEGYSFSPEEKKKSLHIFSFVQFENPKKRAFHSADRATLGGSGKRKDTTSYPISCLTDALMQFYLLYSK